MFSQFMEAWEAGQTVSASAFRANQTVAARLGDPPQYALVTAETAKARGVR